MGSKSNHGFQNRPLLDCTLSLSLMLGLPNFAFDLVVLRVGWDGCDYVGWVGGDGGGGWVGAAWHGVCWKGPGSDRPASLGGCWDGFSV